MKWVNSISVIYLIVKKHCNFYQIVVVENCWLLYLLIYETYGIRTIVRCLSLVQYPECQTTLKYNNCRPVTTLQINSYYKKTDIQCFSVKLP